MAAIVGTLIWKSIPGSAGRLSSSCNQVLPQSDTPDAAVRLTGVKFSVLITA
jgi:hypothetical protein